MAKILVIESPVKAVCITPNTPGSKVPSHGTSKYGEMFAIDFVVINEEGNSKKSYKTSFLNYLFGGLPLSGFYGWGKKIYSPVSGKVIKVIDGIAERNPVNIFYDLKNSIDVTKGYEKGKYDYSHITGNCVIIKCENEVYVLLAHLKKGSITVKENQSIKSREVIGELGHSGNSTMPHLHMQIMDSMDFNKANGIPFVLREYFVQINKGNWLKVNNSIPRKEEIIKFE